MGTRKHFASPVTLLALFVLLAGIPLVALGWLGWRLLVQDRALESQRLRERLDNAASLAGRELDRSLAAWNICWPQPRRGTPSSFLPTPSFSSLIPATSFGSKASGCRITRKSRRRPTCPRQRLLLRRRKSSASKI